MSARLGGANSAWLRTLSSPSRLVAVCLSVLGASIRGITAVPSGLLLFTDPSGELMGLDVVWLDGTPFVDFLVPGIVLLVVLGVGSLVVLSGIGRRRLWAWWAAVGLGVSLVGWIVGQVLLLQQFHVLQIIYGIFAVLPSSRASLRSPGPGLSPVSVTALLTITVTAHVPVELLRESVTNRRHRPTITRCSGVAKNCLDRTTGSSRLFWRAVSHPEQQLE